ncbi:MAG: MerR family transcriptional regulator [Bacteroidota bacterium]|nr:MerR family transcriptional regulator [Bacteroidota bacterium]
MPYKEKETEKLYFTIGEVSEMFKVKTSLIRFWEKEFELIKPHKNNKGNRLFTQTDVSNFHVIFHLVKERGFTLQGAKTKLRESTKDTVDSIEIIKSLNKVKSFLLEIKKEL